MANELAIIERQLTPLAPMFEQLLRPTGVPAARIIRSVLISCERNPKLLECTPTSVIQSATTGAVLGLEADGVTGQGHLVPFNDRRRGLTAAQWITGVRGYNTLGARVGLTIDGEIVREGDDFDYLQGSSAFVRHKKKLGGGLDRRIIGAWAVATAPDRTPIVVVMDIDEINAIRDRSPGYRFGGSDNPWKDPVNGYPGMTAKTPRRRLARSLPLSVFQLAAAVDTAHEELGHHAYLDPHKGVIIEGEPMPSPDPERLSQIDQPRFILHARGREVPFDTIERWRSSMIEAINAIGHGNVNAFRELNQPTMDEYRARHRDHVEAVETAFVIKMQRSPSGDGERPSGVVAGSGDAQGAANNTAKTAERGGVTVGGAVDHENGAEPSRDTSSASQTKAVKGGVTGGESAATTPESVATARDPWFDNADLSIKPPQRGNRPDWPAWSTLFFQKTAIASDGTDLAMLIGSNETNINAFKAALGPMEAQHFDAAIARLYERLP